MSENPTAANILAQYEEMWDQSFIMARRILTKGMGPVGDVAIDEHLPAIASQIINQIGNLAQFAHKVPPRDIEAESAADGAMIAEMKLIAKERK